MIVTNSLKNQHLLWRAGFGPMAENAAELANISQKDLWKLLLKTSAKTPEKIQVADGLADGLYIGIKDLATQSATMTPEQKAAQRKQRQQKSRENLKSLNILWLDEMINSEAQLREKMSLFWHGHFACRVINSYFQQELLDIIRANALGNFGDLLREVSKCPSMLQFLNNQQNNKNHPNENFAREVMELFTMGRGNYTEDDVKQGARAFTGWGFNLQGEFVFRKNVHDTGTKTFLGQTGNFDGDDILNILLDHDQTANFITRKIYRYFVNDKPDDAHVQWLSKRFKSSGYDIKKLLEDIYTSDWFYDEKNIGTRIKSPIELLVGIRRFMPLQLDNDNAQLLFQNVLGQVLFYPPNVAGWPGGKSWIDSSTLMIRLQMPQVFASKESISISPKVDDDVNMGMKMQEQVSIKRNMDFANKGGSADIDWSAVNKIFDNTKRENLAQQIADTLLQTNSRVGSTVLLKYLNQDSREDFIKSAVINLMSTPEYQLS
ncbi:MAG: DUF1800 domain-containing protein [Bacteroidetes bacterium]|nr:DUF1800 domain-containing protein [Bacteroidota bacterium]